MAETLNQHHTEAFFSTYVKGPRRMEAMREQTVPKSSEERTIVSFGMGDEALILTRV